MPFELINIRGFSEEINKLRKIRDGLMYRQCEYVKYGEVRDLQDKIDRLFSDINNIPEFILNSRKIMNEDCQKLLKRSLMEEEWKMEELLKEEKKKLKN
jgi:hypothetical protein